MGNFNPNNPGFNPIFPPSPPITPQALWHWDSSTTPYTFLGFSASQFAATGVDRITKTNLGPSDLQNFLNIPLQAQGLNTQPIPDDVLITWIRWAEDEIEQRTGVMLTSTWVASPQEVQAGAAQAANIKTPDGYMVLGRDFDYNDAPYTFDYSRYEDEGWGALSFRHKPLKDVTYTPNNVAGAGQGFTAVKSMVYIYPLLSQFYAIPLQWVIEDPLASYITLVPSTNVIMLPIYAMQLAMMGFSRTLPGAIHVQYICGFTDNDYATTFSFVKQLVLTKAAIQALRSLQTSISVGTSEQRTIINNWEQQVKYNPAPFRGPIEDFEKLEKKLMNRLVNELVGPFMNTLG
jgi:hypothetical protein